MDVTQQIYLGGAIAAVVAGLVIFYILSKKGPRGAVLITGACLLMLGRAVPPDASREFHVVMGILGLIGLLGVVLGFVDLIRRKPTAASHPAVMAEVVDEKEGDQ